MRLGPLVCLVMLSACVRRFDLVVPPEETCASGNTTVCRCDDGRTGNAPCQGGALGVCDCRALALSPERAVLSVGAQLSFNVERSSDVQGTLVFGAMGGVVVDQSGVMTAQAAGPAVVTVATDDGLVSTSANVTVVDAPIASKILLPAAVTRGEPFVASMQEPRAGYTYSWTVLNADFASAPMGASVTLIPVSEGPLFVSVQAINAAGDAAIPAGAATVVVEPVSESDAPQLVVLSRATAGATVRAYVANANPGFLYQWTLNGVVEATSLPAFTFAVGAAGSQVELSVATANLAGATSSAVTRSITVEPSESLSLFSGQLSADAGSNDGPVSTARLLPASAMRKVGDTVLWLERPVLTPAPAGPGAFALVYHMRSIHNGSVTTLWRSEIPFGFQDASAWKSAGQAAIRADGTAFAIVGSKPLAQSLWTLGPSPMSFAPIPLSAPSGAVLLTSVERELAFITAGNDSLMFSANGSFSGTSYWWLGRIGASGAVTALIASEDDGICVDGAAPQFGRLGALAGVSDESVWFLDSDRSLRVVSDLSGTKTSHRHCGRCDAGDVLPLGGLLRVSSGDVYLFDSTTIKRVAASPVDVDDCAATTVGAGEVSLVRAMIEEGNDLLVADGSRLRLLSAPTGDATFTTVAGIDQGSALSPPVHAAITAFAVDRARGTSWIAELDLVEGEPFCALRSADAEGALTTHVSGPCGGSDGVFGVGGRVNLILAMDVDSEGTLHFIEASDIDAMQEDTVLRTYVPESGRLKTTLALERLVSLSIDDDDTAHLLTRTGYYILAKGATVLSAVSVMSAMGPRGPLVADSKHRSVYLADRRQIRKLTFGAQQTTSEIGDALAQANAKSDGPCSSAAFFNIHAMAVADNGDLFVVDGNADDTASISLLRKVSFVGDTCTVTTVFGDTQDVGARLGPRASARLGWVVGLDFDMGGDLLLADRFEKAVLRYRVPH